MMIINHGAKNFIQYGTKDSRGSKVFSVSGDTPTPGIFELELGMTVRQFVNEFGDGDTKAVQVGGASGFCVPRKKFDETIIGFEGVPTCQQLLLGIEKVKKSEVKSTYLTELMKLADTMKIAAKCGLGQSVGNAFKSIVGNFREEIIY